MSTTESKEGLRQVIGVAGLTLSIVNGVIGAGIFALPGRVGVALGPYGVIGYVVCAIMLAAIMLCYAEIGSCVTTSGGSYAYVEHAFGPFAGYVVNWLYFFGWSILSSAALINIIADSLARIFPAFAHPVARILFFALLTGFMVTLNVRGVRQGIGFVKGVAIVKLIPLLALIVFGIGLIDTENLKWGDMPPLRAFGDATLILFFAFAGFETVLGASGEIRNPRRTVPLGIAFGGLIVLIVYMLLQMVTQGVLGPGIANAVDAPLAAVAERIVGPVGATVLLIAAAVSCFGGVFADILATPRSLFAMSRDGMFPAFLGRVHPRYATPYLAIIAYGLGIFVFASLGGFSQLAILASAAILLIYLAVVLSMIRLRLKKPDSARAFFRAPGGWITPFIAIITILWLLSRLTGQEWVGTIVFVAIICGLYGLARYQGKAE